jgi:hypothetical protein
MYESFFVYVCVCFLWFELWALCFLGSPLWLEPCLQPFCSGYFGDRVSLFCPASLDWEPPVLYFSPLLGWQAHATISSFFLLRWGFENFCLGRPRTAILLISVFCLF